MLRVRLVSDLLDIKNVDEMGRDIEHIGIITKLILRRIIPIHAAKYATEMVKNDGELFTVDCYTCINGCQNLNIKPRTYIRPWSKW